MKTIDRLPNGRFVSHHDGGATVYYDSRHKIVQSKLEGGFVGELVMERTENGYRNQMVCVRGGAPGPLCEGWSEPVAGRKGPTALLFGSGLSACKSDNDPLRCSWIGYKT